MFYNCVNLQSSPELPATSLFSECYSQMFYGCAALTATTSTLPATTLANLCYESMYRNCVSLTGAPYILAAKPTSYCFYGMFNGCTSLSYIQVNLSSWSGGTSPTTNWLKDAGKNVPETTFVCPESLDTSSRSDSRIPEDITTEPTHTWKIVKV